MRGATRVIQGTYKKSCRLGSSSELSVGLKVVRHGGGKVATHLSEAGIVSNRGKAYHGELDLEIVQTAHQRVIDLVQNLLLLSALGPSESSDGQWSWVSDYES